MLEKNLKITDEALTKTKLNRDVCRNKIDQLIKKKNEVETDLRSRQCRALLKLAELPLSSCHDNIESLLSIKERIEKCNKIEVLKGINFGLQLLLKEEAHLSEALEKAEKSISKMKKIYWTPSSQNPKTFKQPSE